MHRPPDRFHHQAVDKLNQQKQQHFRQLSDKGNENATKQKAQ